MTYINRQVSLTLRGMVSSQSGKLITLAALPTHSTITVANICTEIHEEISVDTCLVLTCGVSLVNKKKKKLHVSRTCPIPTHIDDGNLKK